jgi:putative FmdB family regulatory protein
MPIYNYECQKCRNRFELLVGVTASDGELRCPRCESEDIKKQPASFGVNVKSSSSACSTGSCATGTCPTCY